MTKLGKVAVDVVKGFVSPGYYLTLLEYRLMFWFSSSWLLYIRLWCVVAGLSNIEIDLCDS